jgi:hypothetical protein
LVICARTAKYYITRVALFESWLCAAVRSSNQVYRSHFLLGKFRPKLSPNFLDQSKGAFSCHYDFLSKLRDLSDLTIASQSSCHTSQSKFPQFFFMPQRKDDFHCTNLSASKLAP